MQCQCGYTAQYIVGRDGKPCHTCAHSRCKFWAIGPTSCDGYPRVVLGSSSPPEETIIVRFEALRHPEVGEGHRPLPAVMAMCEGDFSECHPVRQILEDPVYEGQWFSARKAYLYTFNQYAPLLSQLQRLSKESRYSLASRNARTDRGAVMSSTSHHSSLNLLLEPIPHFFLKCWDEGNQYSQQFSSVQPDTEDIVYQQLQPFQKKGVEFVLLHGGRGMIADEMGLGKTIQAIAVAHFYRDEWPLLVVCPMSLMENWAKEICRFCSIPFSRIGFIQGKKIVTSSGEEGQHGVQDVIIASYHALKELKTAVFQVLIFDESHYIKTPDSKRTIAALDLSKKAKRVVLLTGTPTLSRPMELYTQLRAIASSRPALLPTNNQFAARYCNAHIQSRGGMYTVNTDGHSHTDELHLLLHHFLIRREKKALQHALPSKSRRILYLTVAEKGRASMAKMVSALKKTVTSQSASGASPGSSGSAYATGTAGDTEEWGMQRSYPNAFELKIATAQVKIPAVMDYVASMVEKHRLSKEKMIVFAHHQCMMDALKDAVEKAGKSSVPVDYILISGETPAGQREELAEHFRTDPHCVVALLSMQSSGVGHNFTCASTVIFSELDWNPSTHLQCEDRVHRIGQSKPCVMQYLLAEGTSDSIIWPLLNTKLSVTTAVLSGSASSAGAQEKNSYGNSSSSSSSRHSHKTSTGRDVKGMVEGMVGSHCPASLLEVDVSERKPLRIGNGMVDAVFGSQGSNGGGGTQTKIEDFFSVSSSQSVHPASSRTSAESHRHSMTTPLSSAMEQDEGSTPASVHPVVSSSASTPLPLLMSFSALATMDPRWKSTGHAPSIPGCHRKVVPPPPPPPSSSPTRSTFLPSAADEKHRVVPSTIPAFGGTSEAAAVRGSTTVEQREGGGGTRSEKGPAGSPSFSPPSGGGPPPPRRTTFKLPAARPSASPEVGPLLLSTPHTASLLPTAAEGSPLLTFSPPTLVSLAAGPLVPPPRTPVGSSALGVSPSPVPPLVRHAASPTPVVDALPLRKRPREENEGSEEGIPKEDPPALLYRREPLLPPPPPWKEEVSAGATTPLASSNSSCASAWSGPPPHLSSTETAWENQMASATVGAEAWKKKGAGAIPFGEGSPIPLRMGSSIPPLQRVESEKGGEAPSSGPHLSPSSEERAGSGGGGGRGPPLVLKRTMMAFHRAKGEEGSGEASENPTGPPVSPPASRSEPLVSPMAASEAKRTSSPTVRADGGAKRTTMVWRAPPTSLSPAATGKASSSPPPPPPPAVVLPTSLVLPFATEKEMLSPTPLLPPTADEWVPHFPSSSALPPASPELRSTGLSLSPSHPSFPPASPFSAQPPVVSSPLPSVTAPLPTAPRPTPMVWASPPLSVSPPSASTFLSNASVGGDGKKSGGVPDGRKRTMIPFSLLPPSPLVSVSSGREQKERESVVSSSSTSPLCPSTTAVEDASFLSLSTASSPSLPSDTLLQAVSRTAEGYIPGVCHKKTFLLHKPSS